MLQSMLFLGLMVVIGALIGGMTNLLAIIMLFRPHRSIHIGKYHLPLTPGLIPKRRAELAAQLGKTVADHLLTAEGLITRLNEPAFKRNMIEWAEQACRELLHSEQTLAELVHQYAGIQDLKQRCQTKATDMFASYLDRQWEAHKQKRLLTVLPNDFLRYIDAQMPRAAEMIIEKIVNDLSGYEGKERLRSVLLHVSQGRGMWGQVLQRMAGNDRVVEFFHKEVVHMLSQADMRQALEKILRAEWQDMLHKTAGEVVDDQRIEQVTRWLRHQLVKQLPLDAWFDTPLDELIHDRSKALIMDGIPKLLDWAGQRVLTHVESVLGHINIENIVKEQIERFPLTRIEEIALAMARKELKWITFIGAFIGGLIGFIQGLIAQLAI